MAISSRNLISLGAVLLYLGVGCARAGIIPYVEPGKTDFDTAMQTLNPYGTWSQINGVWAYTPLDHHPPYSDGRWIYTDYGWCWKGNAPHSWATEHYGYWKLSQDKVWSWYPGGIWYPEIVELRESSGCVGWRPSQVDVNGDFTETDAQRYARPEEWSFVTQQEFAGMITPAIVAAHAPDNQKLLDASTDSQHTYFTYREIQRPGPHPMLFKALAQNGTMFVPHTLADDLATQAPAPPPIVPGLPTSPDKKPVSLDDPAVQPKTTTDPNDPNSPSHKVKYWVIMCLPTFWTPPPADAKENETYFYRPDFYQDEDGIQRRVFLWLNPRSRISATQQLNQALNGSFKPTAIASTNAVPAIPAQPAVYQNPLDTPYNPINPPRPYTPSASSKMRSNLVPSAPAPTNAPPPIYQSQTTNPAPASTP